MEEECNSRRGYDDEEGLPKSKGISLQGISGAEFVFNIRLLRHDSNYRQEVLTEAESVKLHPSANDGQVRGKDERPRRGRGLMTGVSRVQSG